MEIFVECTQKISLRINWWKNFENQSTFAKVIIKHQGDCFLLVHPVDWPEACFLLGHSSVRSSFHPSVLRSCVTKLVITILNTNEPIVLQIGISGQWGKGMKRSIWESGGQRSRSHDAEVRFGGLAEASFSTPSVVQVF